MKAVEPDHSYTRPQSLSQANGNAPSGQPLPMDAFKNGAKSSMVHCGPGLQHSADSKDFPFLPDCVLWGV